MQRKPNQLKPRPPFSGNIDDLISRLNDEIRELKEIQRKGYNVTADEQRVAYLISLKNSKLEQIRTSVKATAGSREVNGADGVSVFPRRPPRCGSRASL